ncbi:hypothetical protein GCM10010129_58010 [Streptomyces fumigatiscleroticus]|nr:hypothetical protein GCM10010129_58010 [Streptomyces fumigatiscleroticus]
MPTARHSSATTAGPRSSQAPAKELLRLLAVAPPLVRQASTDLELGGRQIKAGERVLLSTLTAHHGTGLVADAPDRLDVRRHLAPGGDAVAALGAWLSQRVRHQALHDPHARGLPNHPNEMASEWKQAAAHWKPAGRTSCASPLPARR